MRTDHLVTAEDLERMGERGRWLELVQGELVTVNPLWIVDPRPREVMVHKPGRAVVTLAAGDTLDGGDVLPGFGLSISRLFAALD